MAQRKVNTKENEAMDIIADLNLETITFNIEGIAPLIVSRFDEKSKQQIAEIGEAEQGLKQGGKKKNIANPEEQYKNSIYYFDDEKTCGFPAGAFKAAMVTAAYRTYKRPPDGNSFSLSCACRGLFQDWHGSYQNQRQASYEGGHGSGGWHQ